LASRGTSARGAIPALPARRRLRVGYLSPGFGSHAISQFLLSLLPAHDPRAVEVYCYSTRLHHDRVSTLFKRLCANWFEISGLSDQAAADLIRSHKLDILVDRGGYCTENRVALMARGLASVQVSTADYPATLGMPEVHYHLTDANINPVASQRYYAERLVNLPIAMCYAPPPNPPSVSPLPAARDRCVTFAAFHRLLKLSPTILEAYAEILRRVPRSRLLLHHAYGSAPGVAPKLKRPVRRVFEGYGISPRRLQWIGALPYRQSLELYRQADLGLAAYPCGGVTTTAEALFMGVPVVTWFDDRPISRHSVTILKAVGLDEFAADSAAGFVEIAVEWANDLPRLAGLRRRLRKLVLESPLCDAAAYARSLEAAYREMLVTK
jgi:protein O-GlcNAc transferase